MNICPNKIADFAGISLSIFFISYGMFGSRHNPKFFWSWFGFVQWMYHPCGYESIGITMNEEHGKSAFLYSVW